MTKYIPPVVRVEEDEELEDVLPLPDDKSESEDMFEQFFSSQGNIENVSFKYELPHVKKKETTLNLGDVLQKRKLSFTNREGSDLPA